MDMSRGRAEWVMKQLEPQVALFNRSNQDAHLALWFGTFNKTNPNAKAGVNVFLSVSVGNQSLVCKGAMGAVYVGDFTVTPRLDATDDRALGAQIHGIETALTKPECRDPAPALEYNAEGADNVWSVLMNGEHRKTVNSLREGKHFRIGIWRTTQILDRNQAARAA